MQQRSSSNLTIIVVLAVAVVALAIGFWLYQGSRHSPVLPTNSETNFSSAPTAASGEAPPPADELRELSAAELANVPRPPAVVHATSRAPATQPAAENRPAPSAYTLQLLGNLTNLDLSAGAISKERAEQWKQDLQSLVAQGAAAVPAIRQFLEQNQEFNFAAVNGGDQLGQSSLRAALINALAQIGGPEALQVMVQTLQTTTLPSEIALLGQHLESLAPGQYRQVALSAVNEVLAMAAKGQLSGYDVAPMFELLQNYGDPATLEQLKNAYKYYATLSLANLQSGGGVATLIRQAQNPSELGDFTYQMLSQLAPAYPEAGTALLDLARQDKLSEAAWRKIISGIAGDQYQLGSPGLSAANPGLKTYHIATGNQNFYSVPVAADSQLQSRITLIDQFLSATSNPSAVQALQNAKTTLVNLAPK